MKYENKCQTKSVNCIEFFTSISDEPAVYRHS